MSKIAIFPGSFDPFTKGHFDIVTRATNIFDQVIVGIGNNSSKQRYFKLEFMLSKIKEACQFNPKISVQVYQGLTAEFAKSVGAHCIIRGLRNTTDFEYENTISQANKYQFKELETVFLITDPALAYISSSIVRELHKFGVDVNNFLPYRI